MFISGMRAGLCLALRGARYCRCTGGGLLAVTRPHLIETSQVEEVVKCQQRAENYDEEENETHGAQSSVRRACLLPGRTLPHQFKLKHAHGIFRIGRFLLAALGIH